MDLEPDDGYVQYLLARQQSDIMECFPDISLKTGISSNMEFFQLQPEREADKLQVHVDHCFLVTCLGAPAGITLGKDVGDGVMDLLLDYSFPEYRDFSIGKFMLFQLRERGYTKLIYHGPDETNKAYLETIGFVKKGSPEDGLYERTLKYDEKV